MKKVLSIFVLLFSIMFNNVYAQADSASSDGIQVGEVERIVDKYTEKVAVGIQGLAESLEVPAKHVYEVLVKQAVVDSFVWILVLVLGFLFMAPFWKLFKRDIDWDRAEENIKIPVKVKEGEPEKYIEEERKVLPELITKTIFAIIGVLALIVGIFHVDVLIQGLVNPEYKAIHDIVKMTSDLMK